jgi:hypothetical protein
MEDEYMKRVRERFYKTVRETNWGSDEERSNKPRGRKPKEVVRYESAPRSEGEKRAMQASKSKFFNFN